MNSTGDQFQQIFESDYSSIVSSLSQTYTHDILIVIGFIAISILVLLMIAQFCLKVRRIYRTSVPYEGCLCFYESCLPKFQCTKSNQLIIYEQINEQQTQ